MNCYSCLHSQILEKARTFPKENYSIYGFCHKNGGNYPIYIPSGKCNDYSLDNDKKIKQPESKNRNYQMNMFV